MLTPTITQLQRAVQISEQIEKLEAEMKSILGGLGTGNGKASDQSRKRRGRPRKMPLEDGITASSGTVARKGRKKKGMSAEGRAKIVAAQKARWAKVKGQKVESVAKPERKKKRKLSPESRARIVAAVKARWAREKGTK